MNILKPGDYKIKEPTFHGTCSRCGCEFETKVKVKKYPDDSIEYISLDSKAILHRLGPTILLCECPECKRHVHLCENE